jgi:hypothetical protein
VLRASFNPICNRALPLGNFFLYSSFRVSQVFNPPAWAAHLAFNPMYALAMHWGHCCYSRDWRISAARCVLGTWMLYVLLFFVLPIPADTANNVYRVRFLFIIRQCTQVRRARALSIMSLRSLTLWHT